MKKKNIINLIKCHSENNESGFRKEAYNIARYFERTDDYELAEYIMSLMSDANVFIPQIEEYSGSFFTKIEPSNETLNLPLQIMKDIKGIIRVMSSKINMNKFMFEGSPGTGKTETVKQIARILKRDIYMVNFDEIVDSKLGQTSKNIVSVFNEIANLRFPEKVIILFDEIDAIAMNRVDNNDLREMGRVTSTLLKEFDRLNEKVMFIATTNLFDSFDKALIRRIDKVVNFNRYEKEELIDIAEIMVDEIIAEVGVVTSNKRLFKKILNLSNNIPYPGDLRNIIRNSVVFSDMSKEFDYFKDLFIEVTDYEKIPDINTLIKIGFTLREIECLTGVSKSVISRNSKGSE